MELFIYFTFIFISGLFIGSFLNVVADRTVRDESFVAGRSKCDFCGVFLKPLQLIPLFSFLLQRGKCASCGKKLSVTYPLSEALTGLMFVLAAHLSGVFVTFDAKGIITFVYLAIVFSFFLIIFFADLKYLIIPDSVVYSAIGFVFAFILATLIFDIYHTYVDVSSSYLGKYLIKAGYLKNQITWMLRGFGFSMLSTSLIGLFFVSLILITKGKGMGGGDVKLGLLIGLFNGFPNNILAIFLGFITGSLLSLLLIAVKKKTMKDTIPFGPFLIFGSMIAYVFGTNILNWYFNIL